MHQIKRYIIKYLTNQAVARFSELRPPRTDSNLFSYHLKALLTEGLIEKCAGGYTLTPAGLFLVDRISVERTGPRLQPKILTMTVLQDGAGRVGLLERAKQPFIGGWTLPSGKLHLEESLGEAAGRELCEKTGLEGVTLRHAGDMYIHAYIGDVLVSSVLAHVFHGRLEGELAEGRLHFASPDEAAALPLLPGVGQAIEKTLLMGEERFFSEVISRR